MELAKRVTLHYQAGTSDKIYEVDLYRLETDRYVVNFRYGRRGKSLKESSKTVQPVSLKEAETIFYKLIAEKKKKGYHDVDSPQPETATATETTETPEPIAIASNDPRHQAIVNRLAQQNATNWLLNRVIWRAGELKIPEAVPFLCQLIATEDPLRDYSIAYALGKCGEKSAIPVLEKLLQDSSQPDHVQRIAWEALYQLSDEESRSNLRSQQINKLPSALQTLAENGTVEAFDRALKAYLDTTDYKPFQVLDTLYRINNEFIRPTLLKLLKEAPFQPNYFKPLRHIFKMAEYRCDAEVFGIFAYRFDKEKGTFKNYKQYEYDRQQRRYIPSKKGYLTEQIKKQNTNTKLAYSEQTREYLRRRVWRTLKTLGEETEPDYVKLATEVLLQYSDADGEKVKHSRSSRYDRKTRSFTTREFYWDKFATRIILNHILYENSPRYQSHPQAWPCQGGYKPNDPPPSVREEAFPHLWNENPDALLRLLLESQCFPVHEFAVKALQENQSYCDRLETYTLIQLLKTSYEITVKFAFDLISDRDNSQQRNQDLVLALVNCILAEARQQAYQWIEQQRDYFLAKSDFIAELVTSQQPDTRTFSRRLLGSSILSDETAKVLIGRIIVALLDLDETQGEMAKEVSETLLLSFTPQLRTIGFQPILDLLDHPLPEIQVLGARILLNHETPATELPPDLIESLLSSRHDSVRSVGIRIFGQLPDEKLMRDRLLIIAMAVNPSSEIRQAIRPIIERLSQNYPEFGNELAIDFVDLLLEPERHEGVHKDLVSMLRSQMMSDWMTNMTPEKTVSLTKAKSSIAQELGGIVLQANSNAWWSQFSANQIVNFANHEVLAIRQSAWQMMELKLESIRHDEDEMLCAIKLLEAKWEDSQDFAKSLFNRLNNEDWTPRVMVGVCDSTKEEVRRFGRDIVTTHFQGDYGQEYLLKFSEHPSTDMQMFVTNYLENYATDNEEILKQLTPYFVTVLSGVNKGSVAKKRIFQFLDQEATKSKTAAKIVADILTRQSATIAIADKSAAIQIMLKIKRKYPDLEMPIQVKAVSEIRS